MTELVNQRESADCVIAATAMFTGLTYEEVLAAAKEVGCYRRGRGISESREILERMGFRCENVAFREPHEGPQGREFREFWLPEHYFKPAVLRQFLWGRPAMVSTKSLNQPGHHMIYYDGTRVWDPQDGRRGKAHFREFDELQPVRAFVWRQ